MKKIVTIIFIILLILSCFVSCSNQEAYSYTFTEFFNTTTNLVLYEKESNADQISLSCKEKLRELENKLSLYKEDSDIYKYNRALFGTYVEVSFDTYNCVSKAKQIYLDTNGSFNPLMYRLSDLWGFTDRFSQENFEIEFSYDRENYKEQLPNDEYIEKFLSLTDFNKVQLKVEEDKYYIFKPEDFVEIDGKKIGYELDLGGIAKGYAVSQIKDMIDEKTLGYISIGTSSLYISTYKGLSKKWDIDINNPFEKGVLASVEANNAGISTSGSYEKFYEINGVRYCHIINPNTGKPINSDMQSITLIGVDAFIGDALTTALLVMGEKSACNYLNQMQNITAVYTLEKESNKILKHNANNYYKIKNIDKSFKVETF